MAEEVPVSDVLYSATEYLCKLGSNLQSRSENLKHTKVTKDKLRNAHAVRKAASKLLLLCELSKKSLENVENGVKRVLTIVDSSRRSPIVGAKSENVSLEPRSPCKEYFYFEYDSYKLKISKKILLKHYTSLKVHAKSMPATMLDKYPVYYNCNLYQKRKKAKDSENENKYEVKNVAARIKKNSEKNDTLSSEDTGNITIDLAKEEESDNVSKTPTKKGENITEKTHKNGTVESNSKHEKGIKSVSKESETGSKQNETLLKKDNESEKNRIDVLQKPCDVEKDMENLDSHTGKAIKMDKSKKNHCDMVRETSSDSKPQTESTLEPELISESIYDEKKPTEDKDNELRIKDTAETTRKSKFVRFSDESSESSCKDSVKGNDRKKRKLDKESECNDTVDLIDEVPKKNEISHELIEKTEQKGDESESKPKPMLKLVSLDKLLKPDVIQKLEGNTGTRVLKQTSIKTYRGKMPKRDKTCLLEKIKEVSGFKPKKFNVIVMRLPKFCDSFLCKYGLKTIVKDGNIVYKKGDKEVIGCENVELDVNINKSRKKGNNCDDDIADKSKKELDEGVVKTKNALLNSDSDSSDTITKPSSTTKNRTTKKDAVSKTKAALLNSDSDSSETKNQQKTKKKHSLSQTKVTLLDSDSSDSIKTAKTPIKYSLSRSKTASHESDSDRSGSKQKQETISKHSLSETKTALLNSDSDNSDKKVTSRKGEKDSLSKSKTALLDSDSDSSIKSKQEHIRRNSLSKSKIALLNSDSDNSDGNKNCKTSKKDLSTTKTEIVNSDSDNSNNKNKSVTSKKDTLSKSKTTLLDSDSDKCNSIDKSQTSKKNTFSKSKTALPNSDSDNSDSKRNSKTSKKDTLSKSKTALIESDSDNSDSKRKSETSQNDVLSKSKMALLESDSDNSNSKKKSKTSEKNTSSKSKIAFLESDSDNSDSKKKSKISGENTLSKSKTALLESDSDNSDSKRKSKTPEKDTLFKSKTALLESDSDNSDSKRKSKTPEKDTFSKSKTALLGSDSDNSDSKGKSKTPEKDTLSKSKTALLESDSDNSDSKGKSKVSEKKSSSKTALLESDSDNSDSKGKSKTPEKDTLSKSKTALLESDSDNSGSKGKSKVSEKKSSSKSKTALLESDSDNSDSKRKSKTPEKDTLSKSKTALLESDSDNSDSKRKSKTPEKDTLSKSKTALLESDSDNSDSNRKSKTPEKDTLSKSKSALLESDSDSSSKRKRETKRRGSLSKNKSSLPNSDSDNLDGENNPVKSKKYISITKNALLDSDSHSSDSKNKIALINNSCSERAMSQIINEQIETLSCNNLDKSGKEPNKEFTNLVSDSPSNNAKGNDADADECNLSKSVESPEIKKSKKLMEDHTTTKSKRKMIMESMQAKKMLLNYSSSSDTDDEQLKNAMKDVRNSLLNLSSSSDDEINVKKIIKANRRQLVTPSDSDGSLNKSKLRKKRKKEPLIEKEVTSICQFDGTKDEQSDNSSSQMGRSKTKVASSSNQSSENMDSNDIEINRLTDLSSLNRRRRRDSRKKAGPRSTRKMPKAPLIEEETLGPSTSDAASDVESDVGEVEELPAVSMQDLNGDGINHLAKEDLLAQSDTSSSQNEKANGSEEDKKEDSDEEDNVKSIRRKTNAISSDSEVGSSRRREEKVSDFEDSEAESEPRRKTKRKKKGSDSDASLSSNDGSKKKRRRIKQVNDSDGSGSDSENEGKNKHGRKNIRKVMSKDQLEEATKKAARQEKERIARIAERQKLYNNLEFDESGKPDEVVLDKVVLDFDPDTKEPLIEVDRGLVKKLKPHQANGIKFMWNACFESVKRIKKDRGSGCILAHCMGLGKTLQVVSLTHTLLTHGALTGVRRVLVVCPLSTVLNWVNEFTMWLKHAVTDYEVDVFELSRHKQNSERSWQLQQWVECGGVCVLGYEMFRNLSADNNKKFKKKMLKTFQEALVDPGPDLVVCDEGHLLKNEKTSLSQSMNRVRTLRRIVLTGTPLQNNLKEYYCMVQFVKPNLLGKYNEYLNRFVNPITNGQYTDSTERDISIMKRRSHVLHTMLDGAVQRRDYGVLAPFLPPKHEFVLFITLTEIQIKLYQHYLDNYSRRPLPGKSSGFLFPDFQSLQRIWTHPLVLKYNSERYEIMQQKKRDKEEEDSEGSIADFIDDDSTPEESSTEESTDDLSDASDDSRKKSKKKKSAKKGKGKDSKATARRGTRANPIEMAEEDKPNSDIEEVKYENPTEWWMKLVTDEELEDIRHSHKLLLLFDILRQCEAIGDKLLVFSQSLYSLDLIEHFLGKVDEATQDGRIDEKLAGHVGSWSPGVDYFRLDGSTSCENRSIWCKNFNREDNPRARLFLISTRAGGLGINLVAANRVVIFDVSWNPSHDVQSIFRVYRFGQKKPCYIYRFLAMGTMEEKIYERQVTKQAISKRVIDEQQIDRHYAANDLAELYKFEPEPPEPRPVPSLPKDRLFAEMLKDHEKQIYRFHEHDSLLENKEEETLSEEERKRAWEEFENEKRAPPPAPFPSTWSMHNGMASLLQQQQQQLAYTALAAMIRKDMPNITDNQMRDMLPIICNANPGMFGGYDYGLMQKMNEIYKYAAQPGLMNPSMMNPVMNPASGMSTSSSLQYEPPWQRQQQQQQQMRLQQLMQQQHSMGAKYYAGGLGSRDPVAMALQQQRAREFLLGPGGAGAPAPAAGRPRGRPPLQPRAPAAADVVNLADSD